MKLQSFVPLLLLLFVAHSSNGTQVSVQTSLGAVHGFHVDYGNDVTQLYSGAADVFLGIPYAIPPVGELSFEPRYSRDSKCDEDCLQLNVMSPSVTSGRKYPVKVWIHGGGYTSGSAYTYDYKGGVRNFVSKGVVLITIQYRLGALGFFTTLSEEFPANRGTFDQLLALHWIQEEIGSFGGDPSQVTIFGESAGGCAVSALSLSPLARGLFHRIIQQSGGELLLHRTADSPLPSHDKQVAQEVCATSMKMPGRLASLSSCMRGIDWRTLINVTQLNELHGFAVYADGFLFPDTVTRLAEQRPNFPVLLGNVRDEMTGFINPDVVQDTPNALSDLSVFNSSNFSTFLNITFPYLSGKSSLLADIIRSVYMRAREIPEDDHLEWFKIAVEALGDMIFAGALRNDATHYAANGNRDLFLYTYDYMSVFGGNVSFGGWRAVPHASELRFLWKYKFDWEPAAEAGTITEDDKAIADFLSDAWTSFAIKGKPSLDWPSVSSPEQMEFYRITTPKGRFETQYLENAHAVYNSVFPSLLGEFPVETTGPESQKWLEEHYKPKIRAEYEKSLKCDAV